MKFTFWIFLITTSLSQIKAGVNIERTIEKVQNILKQNSKLPQLTREEILQLLEDIRANDATSTSASLHELHITTPAPEHNDLENEINNDILLTTTEIPKTVERDTKHFEVDEETLDEAFATSKANSNDLFEATTLRNWHPLEESISYDDKRTSNTKHNQPFEVTTVKEWYSFDKGLARDVPKSTTKRDQVFETTTKKGKPALMVVLPYTQSDGSTLQELYTRPPRIKVLENIELDSFRMKQNTISQKTPSTESMITHKLNDNSKIATSVQTPPELAELSAELKEFLDAHGLKGNPGPDDHFLLPLEGFKPLPPARTVDGSVQLPENILLTYDLISPSSSASSKLKSNNIVPALSPNNFLFDPIKPKYPFELDASASNPMTSFLPLELPNKPKIKTTAPPDYSPIDYDSVKIVPLSKGPNPINDVADLLKSDNELNKRQTANSSDLSVNITISTGNSEDNVTRSDASIQNSDGTPAESINNSSANITSDDSASASADAGASIADLEDSFGAPAPSQPGDSTLPPQRKNGFYWMLDWNSFLEVGDGDRKVNIRLEPKLGDPQMFLPINVP